MKTDQILKIRRSIVALAHGESCELSIDGVDAEEINAEAKRFSSARKLPCMFVLTGTGVLVTRAQASVVGNVYPELDALEVGGSKLFQFPPAFHQKIRLAASHRAKAGKVRLACTREGEFIRVTRLPATESEAAACGPILAPARATKYDMERLAEVRELRFDVPRADHAKIRLAAHRQMIKTGWTIRCRLQDDGSMLVYRTDSGLAAQAQQAAE